METAHCSIVHITCWYEEGVSLIDGCHVAVWDLVSKEDLTLIGGHDPVLIAQEVLLGGWNQVEHLVTL